LEDLVIDVRIILRRILRKWFGKSHTKLCCWCEHIKKCQVSEKVRKGVTVEKVRKI